MSGARERVITNLLREVTGRAASAHELVEEAKKTILNTLACAVGAVGTEPMAALISASEDGSSAIVGTSKTASLQRSALLNGMLAHFEDYDDTHATYRTHGGAPVVGATVALGSRKLVSGPRFLTAVIAGMEFHYRIAGRMMPEHHRRGWHPTGTFGVLGAAVAGAVVQNATLEQIESAVQIGAGMTVGVREVFGTEVKPFNAGKAAANGVLASRLAMVHASHTGPGLAASDGYLAALAGEVSLDGLGPWPSSGWELLRNTYKPYPCGKVVHPIIDAAIELREVLGAAGVDHFEVRCHPEVVDVAGVMRPTTSLEAKFSSAHGFATGYLRGTAQLQDFAEEAVSHPEITALLESISIVVDPSIDRRETVVATAWLVGGGSKTVEVTEAFGSIEKPMSYDDIYRKAVSLTETVDPSIAPRLRSAIDGLESGSTSADIIAACRPETATRSGGSLRRSEKEPPPAVEQDRILTPTDAVAAFCSSATPPRRVLQEVLSWHTKCLTALGDEVALSSGSFPWPTAGAARVAAALDDEQDATVAFLTAYELARAPLSGIPRLFIPVLAAIYTVSRRDRPTVEQLGSALAIGLEVGLRLQSRLRLGENKHWDVVGSIGAIAGAAAVAALDGRPEIEVRSLLALTGTQVGGVGMLYNTGLSEISVAKSAASAIEARGLVAAGLLASVDIVGGRRGLLAVIGSSPHDDWRESFLDTSTWLSAE